MTHFFVPFAFSSSSSSSVNNYVSFSLITANSVIIFPPNSSFANPITFLYFPFGNGLSNSYFRVSNIASISFAMPE